MLGAGAVGALAAIGAARWRNRDPFPDTRPIPSAPGFHRVSGARAITGGTALALTALPNFGDEPVDQPTPLPRDALITALFGAGRGPTRRIALFSDTACPPCRRMEGRLAAAGIAPQDVALHDWPRLGPRSVAAARVAVAARRQNAGIAMHRHLLHHSLRPSEAGTLAAAAAVGIDGRRLLADLDDPSVDHHLATTRRVAWQLGLAGTPSLVVGPYVIEGVPTPRVLRRALARPAPSP